MPLPKLPTVDERDRHIDPITDSVDVEIEDEPLITDGVTELEDGSAVIELEEETQDGPGDFLENLAEFFEEVNLSKTAIDLIDLIEEDKKARESRDKKYEDGLRRTGLGDDAPGGASFEGSSKVVHPILAESCVDFESRAIKELFPPSGPVKTQIIGKKTEDKLDRADRKAKYLNYQLTTQMTEYRTELEQLLTQLPMGGSQYQKFWYDPDMQRPRSCFVPIDDVLLPYSVSDFYSSHRKTHTLYLTESEVERRMTNGMYRDINLTSGNDDEQSAAGEANDKIEGRNKSGINEDGTRTIYECYVNLLMEEDDLTEGKSAPYIITIDKDSGKVLALYRNWREEDEKRQPLQWMVEWKFIPWRGAYAIGLPHLIGGLSAAATGALRALLDSAHINNTASLVKLKAGKTNGENIVVEPGQVANIDAPAGTDDIRKVMMAMPYNQPSSVLFSLLGWLTDAGKNVVATTQESMTNMGDRTPVGTMMAMVEQGAVIYSAIHARLHSSQAMALNILCRINRDFMDDQQIVEELDELIVERADFINNQDIIPVTDPNIFSESQRFAQVQGISQIMQLFPNEAFDYNYIARMMLKRMRVDDIDAILPETKKPQNMNPAGENVAALQGTPLLALPNQNHMAHILMHLEFAGSPIFGSPQLGMKALPSLIEHIKQHIGFLYSGTMAEASEFSEFAAEMPTKEMESHLFTVQTTVLNQLNTDLEPILGALAQLEQKAQQMAPPPPVDPAIQATKEVAMADIERKKAYDGAMIQIKQAEAQAASQNDMAKHQTALTMNDQDNKQRQLTELLKNHEDNQTTQWVAAMKASEERMMNNMQQRMDLLVQNMQAIMNGERDKLNLAYQAVKDDADRADSREQADADREFNREQSQTDRDQAAKPTKEE